MAGFRRRMPVAESAGHDDTARSARAGELANGMARARSHRRIALLALGVVLALTGVAIAGPTGDFVSSTGPGGGLVAAGPVNPVNGFPDWYRDNKGLELQGCMNPRDPNCGAIVVPDGTQPVAFPGNFPKEFFYMLADAPTLKTGSGDKVVAQFALEGAFAGTGAVVDGQQMAFARIRFRINTGLVPDTDYKITHPYGTDVVHSGPTTASPNLYVTQDVGITPGAFTQVLGGRVGPFLTWDTYGQTPAAGGPPAGYVGDGATPHKVTGSDLGTNFVRIEGPGIGGANNPNPCPTSGPNPWVPAPGQTAADCIQTDLFTLLGKLSTNGGVDVARASYSRVADGSSTQIDVYGLSRPGQDIVVQDTNGGATPAFPTTPLQADGGRYYARVDVTGALPATVDVINRGDIPQTVKTVKVADLVTGTAAYDTGTDTLHVQGKSSDLSSTAGAPSATLSVPAFTKTLDATGAGDIVTVAPPASVTISSSKGGSMTVPVEGQGAPLAPLPLVASAGADVTVAQGAVVKLDGSGSTGNISAYKWTSAEGLPLVNGDTKIATYTATTAGDHTFTLAVTGVDGSPPTTKTVTDDIIVHVTPVQAPVAKIAAPGPTVPQNWPVTLDGKSSTGATTYQWDYVPGTGDPAIALNPATLSMLDFRFPKTTNTLTFRLTVRNSADTGTGSNCDPATCNQATVTLAGQPDPLAVTKARFTAGSRRWVVAGTATSTMQNDVTVHAGPDLSGPVIGTRTVDPLGNWQLDVRNSLVAGATTVSVESTRGGESLGAAVR
jgi:hypothetical protein